MRTPTGAVTPAAPAHLLETDEELFSLVRDSQERAFAKGAQAASVVPAFPLPVSLPIRTPSHLVLWSPRCGQPHRDRMHAWQLLATRRTGVVALPLRSTAIQPQPVVASIR